MPKLISLKRHGEIEIATRYIPVPLGGWYLVQAARHARRAQQSIPKTPASRKRAQEAIFESSFLTVLYSALALEAGANQVAEDVFPDADLPDFEFCRNKFAVSPVGSVTRCIWKWKLLFESKGVAISAGDEPLAAAEALIHARHKFEHYKPTAFAMKAVFERRATPGVIILFSDREKPTRIEPSVVQQELAPSKSRLHYLAARAVFARWGKVVGWNPAELDAAAPLV